MSYLASAAADLTFPGRLAYDCLQSIPFNSHDGVVFVKELRKWLQFHTTIDALKSGLTYVHQTKPSSDWNRSSFGISGPSR